MNSINRSNLLAVLIAVLSVLVCLWLAMPRPDSGFARLGPSHILLNIIPAAYFFVAFWLISRRPLSAAVLTAGVCLAVTLGSNFKFSVTSQPLVASDFVVFQQVLENPGLFEKYFRQQWYFVPVLIVMVIAAGAIIRLERPIVTDKRLTTIMAVAGVILLLQIQTILLQPQAPLQYIYKTFSPEFDHRDPMTSVSRQGLFTTLMSSARASYFTLPTLESFDYELINNLSNAVAPDSPATGTLPNLIIVQNEAFFDFRVIDSAFPDEAYTKWDELKKYSHYGQLAVNTYGGATLRTEFSVLTGIPTSIFGAALDYPYMTAVSQPIDSLPRHLKSFGYQTIAIHPFNRTFWRRHLAYPRLGFDRFLAIEEFEDSAYDGPFVSDLAVCRKIIDLLGDGKQPKFVFAVTMENHGPWSFERGQTGDLPELDFDDANLDEETELRLRRFLYHAQNAASMAECLIDGQANQPRPSLLLFYGDHAPAMPGVFEALGVGEPWRDPAIRSVPYLLWNPEIESPRATDTVVSALPAMFLESAQLPKDDYLRLTEHLRANCLTNGYITTPTNCPDSPNDALGALIRSRLQPLDQTVSSPGVTGDNLW